MEIRTELTTQNIIEMSVLGFAIVLILFWYLEDKYRKYQYKKQRKE